MKAHKLSAAERIASFDPAGMDPMVRKTLRQAGAIDDAAHILPFTILSVSRLKGIARAVAGLGKIEGETAEIGCNAGGTTRLIARANGGRRHWACDTFTGIADAGEEDAGSVVNGSFSNRLAKEADVARRMADLNVIVVGGYFPDCAPVEMAAARFAFVHIDVDSYRSVLSCFAFFSGRMAPGGLMALDDVIGRGTRGAKRAWSEILSSPAARHFDIIERNDPQVIVRFK